MQEPTPRKIDRETLLEEVLATYWKVVEAGSAPDRQEWLRRYPELSAELSDFFADEDYAERWVAPLRTIRRAATPAESWGEEPVSLVGQSVGDHELLSEIGQGGMGVVYKARRRQLNRLVALKMIRGGPLTWAAEVQRFRNEAEAQLDHPHIVPIYEIGMHQGRPYFSMKLFEGGTLSDHLDRYAADCGEAARLMVAVAGAVHHAHQRGLLHRDLKPSNILLDADEQPHVTDFGLAKLLTVEQGQTQSGLIVGTPAFMAPEQTAPSGTGRGAAGGATTASDVYGLGAILYTLLTGAPPFQGPTSLDVLWAVRHQQPLAPGRVNLRVDRDLSTICLKCLEKERRRRYASAEALAEDLGRWLAHEPILARPCGTAERSWRWCRRNPWLAAGAACAAAALAVGVAVLAVALMVATHARQTAEVTAIQLRDRLYPADMQMAHRHWERGEANRMQGLLAQYEPQSGQTDLRGFEWHLLQALARTPPREAQVYRGHTKSVYCALLSPDGQTVASASADRTIHLWDAETGACRAVLRGHQDDVNCVDFSPDGQTLVSASEDGTLRLWDVGSGVEQAVLEGHRGLVGCVFFSPDGQQLLSGGGDRIVRLWDVAGRRLEAELPGHEGRISVAVFSADGQSLASCALDGTVIVWDRALRRQRIRIQVGVPLCCVSISPDGATLATASTHGTVQLWQAETGQHLKNIGRHTGAARCALFSPDGEKLVSSGDDGRVCLWSLPDGILHSQFTAHSGKVWCALFARGGHRLVTASQDGSVKLWDLATGARHHRSLPGTEASGLAFDPSGRTLHLWRERGFVELWDRATWTRRAVQSLPEQGGKLYALAPDGRTLLVSGFDEAVRQVDLAGGTERVVLGARGFPPHFRPMPGQQSVTIRDMTFTPDGSVLALVYEDGSLRLWYPAGDQEHLAEQGPLGTLHTVAASPDSKLLAVTDGLQVRLWNVEQQAWRDDGAQVPAAIDSCEFSHDGRLVAVGCHDGRIAVLAVPSLAAEAMLFGHRQPAICLAFAPDGRTLASGSNDGTVRLWHVSTGQELFVLEENFGHQIRSLAFSADQNVLAILAATGEMVSGTVSLWFARPEDEIGSLK